MKFASGGIHDSRACCRFARATVTCNDMHSTSTQPSNSFLHRHSHGGEGILTSLSLLMSIPTAASFLPPPFESSQVKLPTREPWQQTMMPSGDTCTTCTRQISSPDLLTRIYHGLSGIANLYISSSSTGPAVFLSPLQHPRIVSQFL